MEETKELITTDDIRSKVYIIRGQQVMLDKDLAEIYGYEVKKLNQQVKRNIERFPEDFMFRLSNSEIDGSMFTFDIYLVKCCNSDEKVHKNNWYSRIHRHIQIAFIETFKIPKNGILPSAYRV